MALFVKQTAEMLWNFLDTQALLLSSLGKISVEMFEITSTGQSIHKVVGPGTSHPHVSLPAQPLLACTAVLDVLEDLGEHGTLQTLLLPCLLQVIIGPGT